MNHRQSKRIRLDHVMNMKESMKNQLDRILQDKKVHGRIHLENQKKFLNFDDQMKSWNHLNILFLFLFLFIFLFFLIFFLFLFLLN